MGHKLPIAGRTHCWAFAAGCALVLVALLTLAHAGRAGDRALAPEAYTRVLDVVTRLDGCPVCHTVAGQESGAVRVVLADAYTHRIIELPDPRPAAAESQPAQVNERLVTVGQRLLDALPDGDARAGRAAEEYLAIVDEVGADDSPATLLTALERLERLDSILRALEREAGATTFWRAHEPPPASAGVALAALAGTPPRAALSGAALVTLAAGRIGKARPPSVIDLVPTRVAFAFSRRGPPALGAISDSVQREDCRIQARNLLFVVQVLSSGPGGLRPGQSGI